VSNFEKITVPLEALGEFLSSLPIATGPWDESFHRQSCDSWERDKRENCGTSSCPHKDERNNPTWWLKLGAAEETNAENQPPIFSA